MICKEYRALISGYADDELSEAQAAPLRQHMIDCQACRKVLAGEVALKRWFEPEPELLAAVPSGFAERVARRAFDGDTGEALVPAGGSDHETPLLQFVLRLTAAAAVLLLVASALMRNVGLPAGDHLRAELNVPTNEEIIEQLEILNREAAVESAGPAEGLEPGSRTPRKVGP